MKKVYIKPQVVEIAFAAEGVIAASKPNIGVNNDGYKITGEDEMLTNKQDSPWNSTNWE